MSEPKRVDRTKEELLLELDELKLRIGELERQAAAREQADESLRIRTKVFRQIFEEGPIGMHLVTPSFHLLEVNEALCQMLGRTKEELTGLPLVDIVHPDDVSHGLAQARRMRSGEISSYTVERRYLRQDGDIVLANVTASIIRDESGRPQYGIGMVENITDRRLSEEDRKRLEEQLRQSQKMEAVGRLAGGIAHDFNNLLTVILGNASLLRAAIARDPVVSAEDDEKRLSEIIHASERASSLTRQLLTFSRKDVFKPEILEPNRVVTETEMMLRRLIGEDISLDVMLGEDTGYIRADRSQLEQVILNLALNARDAMPDGGRLEIITSSASLPSPSGLGEEQGGRHAVLTFRDDGRGMSEETLERAYEPFYTTKPPGEGTGLGLATVYAIVTQSDGHLQVESELGEGTTVRAYFPSTLESSMDAADVSAEDALGGNELILVREDDVAVRRITCQILRESGYEVLEAASADEAMGFLERDSRRPELLITDVVMPDVNGRDLAATLSAKSPGMAVLFISGYTSQILDPHGVEREPATLLQKPFTPSELLRRVRERIESSRSASKRGSEVAQ